jgi:hypothetical protein
MAALVIVDKPWNQPQCPSTDEKDKDIHIFSLYMYKYIYYVYIFHAHNGVLFTNKEVEIMIFSGNWMKLEIIMLSKISKVQKQNSHMLSLKCEIHSYKK